MTVHLGFTGTRAGMTPAQYDVGLVSVHVLVRERARTYTHTSTRHVRRERDSGGLAKSRIYASVHPTFSIFRAGLGSFARRILVREREGHESDSC